MRAAFLWVSVTILSGGVVLTAQSPTGSSEQRTIVGCLVQGLPPAERNEQRPKEMLANQKAFFLRTPTVTVPVGTSLPVGTPGTPSTATPVGTPTADSFYRISGLAEEQLKPHLGHRVELQGALSASGPEGTVTSARTTVDNAGRATTTGETRILVAGVLQATAIRMVSTTCKPE